MIVRHLSAEPVQNRSMVGISARVALLVSLVATAAATAAPQRLCRELETIEAPEAHQAVAVDGQHVYAISSRAIAKYGKRDGKLARRWESSEAQPLLHLNSGVVVDGELFCAHSNWPVQPYDNTVQVWNAETLEHDREIDLDGLDDGAITWIDRFDGAWWIVFAHYGKGNVAKTTLMRLDDKWRRKRTWSFPDEIVARFSPMSNSGGSFGPDGLLYATGHDLGECYALAAPKKGSTMRLLDVVPAPVQGQGIAWDRTQHGTLFGIRRRDRVVVKTRLSHRGEYAPLKHAMSWKRSDGPTIDAPPTRFRTDRSYSDVHSEMPKRSVIIDQFGQKHSLAAFGVSRACFLRRVGRGKRHGFCSLYFTRANHGVIELATSRAGITWHHRGPVLFPDSERDYEDESVRDPFVIWSEAHGFRMWYTAVGSARDASSICCAESDDGVHWRRGDRPGANLQLTAPADGWERGNVDRPVVTTDERDRLRLHYRGDLAGSRGTGVAVLD